LSAVDVTKDQDRREVRVEHVMSCCSLPAVMVVVWDVAAIGGADCRINLRDQASPSRAAYRQGPQTTHNTRR
jgi:hypothetical protein